MSDLWKRAVAAIGDAETDEEFRGAVDAALKLAPIELSQLIGYYSGHPAYWNGALDGVPEAIEALIEERAAPKAG